MSLPESNHTRKSTANQESTDKRTTELLDVLRKFRVVRKASEKTVRLKHEFLMAWAPILTASAFKVYVLLERYAWFVDGPLLHHTNGYMSLSELATTCGMKLATCKRALRELSRHRLVIFGNPDPADRRAAGRKLDLEINQDARPTPDTPTLLGAKLPADFEECRRVDLPPSGDQVLPPSGDQVLPPRGDQLLTPSGDQVPSPLRGSAIGSSVFSSGSSATVESLSSSVLTAKPDDDEGREKLPNLTPLREAVKYIVDDAWLIGLVTEARAAAPDITDDELARVIACKREHIKDKTGIDPVPYLKTCVLNAIAGEGLAEWRGWFAVAAAATGGQWRP